MTDKTSFRVAVLAGDGIGPEVTAVCIDLLAAVQASAGGFDLQYEHLDAGAAHYQRTGTAMSDDTLQRAGAADAILLGAMGLPAVRYDDGTEISPQLDLREKLDLYAGVRPIRTMPGLPVPLADPRARDLDLVLVRESTEGLFAARGNTAMTGDDVARDTMVISRKASERVVDFALRLAERRKTAGKPGRLTCVDKANVLGSFAFFRRIFDERAKAHPDVTTDHCYVDACGLTLVKQPWVFDVLVTENMFGDILSDVGAALMGGMGMAASADIGDTRAVFQPAHGSAPDIMGQGKANPTAMFLSAGMMLDWLGTQHGNEGCARGARIIDDAVRAAYAGGALVPTELGGDAGTATIASAVIAAAG